MKKTLLLLALLIPNITFAFATTSAPFVATTTTQIFPNKINGVDPAIFIPNTGTSTFNGSLHLVKNLQVDGNFFAPISLQLTGFTQGSALFVGPSGTVAQNNANFFWDNVNGRLGIGTTNPGSKLNVVGLSTFQGSGTQIVGFNQSGGNNAYIATVSNTDESFLFQNSGGTTNVKFDKGGNVGIGTTNPLNKLDVNGSVAVGSYAGANVISSSGSIAASGGGIFSGGPVGPTGTTNVEIGVSSGVGYISAFARGTGAVPLNLQLNGGNLGVASSTPWALLSVNPNGITGPSFVIGSSTKTDFAVLNSGKVLVNKSTGFPTSGSSAVDVGGNLTLPYNGSLQFQNNVGNDTMQLMTLGGISGSSNGIRIGNPVGSNSGWNDLIQFTAGNFSDVGEAMRITAARLVGIGTTSPFAKLSIAGDAYVGGNLTATGTTALQTLIFTNATGTSATTTNFFSTTASSTNLFTSLFAAGGNTLVTTAAGNVGVGTTSPYQTFSVAGNQVISNPAGTATLNIYGSPNQGTTDSFDVYHTDINASNPVFQVMHGGASTKFGFRRNVGGFTLTADSGLLDYNLVEGNGNGTGQGGSVVQFNNTGISFATRAAGSGLTTVSAGTKMFIDSSTGNVGIGTTSPYAKLSIQSGASTGDAFAVATTTGKAVFGIDNDGHEWTSGPAPALSACGVSPSVIGNDQGGAITVGTGVVLSCTMTFSKAYRNLPYALMTINTSGVTGGITSISTTAITFSFSATVGGGIIYYDVKYAQ